MSKKPCLYRGKAIPYQLLGSDEFEDFTYKSLSFLGDKFKFTALSGRMPSSDGGYDVTAKSTLDDSFICIQCKRYKEPLGLNTLSDELIKIALNSFINNTQVSSHLLITTGQVREKVRTKLKEKNLVYIIDMAIKRLDNDSFKKLNKACKEKKADPAQIVKEYILNLQNIFVWSHIDFDQMLGTIWSKLNDIIEKHFDVENILREYPRPDFSYSDYKSRTLEFSDELVELYCIKNELPYNLERFNPSNPLAGVENSHNEIDYNFYPVSETIKGVKEKKALVLIGPGGSGKSTTLQQSLSILKENDNLQNSSLYNLPIYIRLSTYIDSIDTLIHNELNINFGNWKSIPANIILLFDGLDEIPDNKVNIFLENLKSIIEYTDVKVILTLRETGLRTPAYFEFIDNCFLIQPLSFRDCYKIAKSKVGSNYDDFLEKFKDSIERLDFNLLTLPFGISTAIRYYLDFNALPDNLETLINNIIENRIKINKSRSGSLYNEIKNLSSNSILEFASTISFHIRVIVQKASISRVEAEDVIKKSLKILKSREVFGFDDITDSKAFDLALHFEFLNSRTDNSFYFDHDIISDCLASKELARSWSNHINHLNTTIAQDSWVFATKYIEKNDLDNYINQLLAVDIVLAAECIKEVQDFNTDKIEQRILSLFYSDSRIDFSRAASAMSVLKLPSFINALKQGTLRNDLHRRYQSNRALALIGDPHTLQACLDHSEPMVSGGLKVSGGEHDLWYLSPPMKRIKIARQQIKKSISDDRTFATISLQTIEHFGDLSDYGLAKTIMLKTSSLSEFYAAVKCIYALDRGQAIKDIQEIVEKEHTSIPSIYAIECLALFDVELDTKSLIEELVTYKEIDSEQAHGGFDRAVKVIKKYPISPTSEVLLFENYPKIGPILKSFYWDIASTHKLKSFIKYANEAIASEQQSSLIESIAFKIKIDSDKDEIISDCKKMLDKWYPVFPEAHHVTKGILEKLIELGELELSAKYIEETFIKFASESKKAELSRKNKVLKNLKGKMSNSERELDFFLTLNFLFWIPTLLKVKSYISEKALLSVIGLNSQMTNDNTRISHSKIIEQLPYDKVDHLISKIKSSDLQLYTMALCPKENKSTTQRHIFNKLLPELLLYHPCYKSLAILIKKFWDDDLLILLVQTLISIDWPDSSYIQMFDKIESTGFELITSDQAQKIIFPEINNTISSDSKEVLKVWYDYATKAKK